LYDCFEYWYEQESYIGQSEIYGIGCGVLADQEMNAVNLIAPPGYE
jgi:hypothetical protein